jgi:hypothetical protein
LAVIIGAFVVAAIVIAGARILLISITMSVYAAHSGVAQAARHYLVASAYQPARIQVVWGMIWGYYPPFRSSSTDAFALIQSVLFTVVVGGVIAIVGIASSWVAFLALFSYGIMKTIEIIEKTTFKYSLTLLGAIFTLAGLIVDLSGSA